MTEQEIKNIALKSTFDDILNSLNLTDRQRTIFILRYGRGFQMADICAEVGYSRETVRNELYNIRKKMAQI